MKQKFKILIAHRQLLALFGEMSNLCKEKADNSMRVKTNTYNFSDFCFAPSLDEVERSIFS